MIDLVEFLLARVAEREKVARAAAPEFFGGEPAILGLTGRAVLAECEAVRRVVEAYPSERRYVSDQTYADAEPRMIEVGWTHQAAVLLLAQPYADHPDFRAEWKL